MLKGFRGLRPWMYRIRFYPPCIYYGENRSVGHLKGGMKQRIRVVGIIRNEDGVLIFKRNRVRSEAPVFWELPTGKIKFGEQPEEAMVRTLSEYANLTPSSVKIKDVITFLALEGSSRLCNLYIVYEIKINGTIGPEPQDRYTAYKFVKDFSSTNVKLNEASLSVMEIVDGKVMTSHVSPRDTATSVTIYVDGASRGNPGPSGIGYNVVDVDGHTIERGGKFIGFATSRVAEYYAMRNGINLAIKLGLKTVRFVSDSLMVVNQLNGIFAIKNQDILPIYQDIEDKLKNFEAVSFTHIPRSSNSVADHEANAAIDRMLQG